MWPPLPPPTHPPPTPTPAPFTYVQLVDLFTLNPQQRKAFFINLYNALVIHGLVVMGFPDSAMKRVKFFGQVGGHSPVRAMAHCFVSCPTACHPSCPPSPLPPHPPLSHRMAGVLPHRAIHF